MTDEKRKVLTKSVHKEKKMDNNNYREELVAIIKDMGKDLIERAEEMVAEGAKFIGDFHIDIDIPNPMEEAPSITYYTKTFSTNFMDRKFHCDYHAEGGTLK